MKGNQMNIKIGDKVRYTGQSKHDMTHGKVYEVRGVYEWCFDVLDDAGDTNSTINESYELVTPALPPIWDDMNDAEKGALLLAKHEGKVIEYWSHDEENKWIAVDYPAWAGSDAYRVAPEQVETLDVFYHKGFGVEGVAGTDWQTTHRITFNTRNGKPDPDSIKMEEL